jgi:hypothetical protein
MRYYVFENGKIFDSLMITIDNEVVLRECDFFNPGDEVDIDNLFFRINKKKRKGNLCVYSFFRRGKNGGDFGIDFFCNYTDKKAFCDYFKKIEYKNL